MAKKTNLPKDVPLGSAEARRIFRDIASNFSKLAGTVSSRPPIQQEAAPPPASPSPKKKTKPSTLPPIVTSPASVTFKPVREQRPTTLKAGPSVKRQALEKEYLATKETKVRKEQPTNFEKITSAMFELVKKMPPPPPKPILRPIIALKKFKPKKVKSKLINDEFI